MLVSQDAVLARASILFISKSCDIGCNMVIKKKKISIKRYNTIMDNIIKMGKPVSDTLIDLLEEASKYEVKNASNKAKRRSTS